MTRRTNPLSQRVDNLSQVSYLKAMHDWSRLLVRYNNFKAHITCWMRMLWPERKCCFPYSYHKQEYTATLAPPTKENPITYVTHFWFCSLIKDKVVVKLVYEKCYSSDFLFSYNNCWRRSTDMYRRWKLISYFASSPTSCTITCIF